MPVASRSPSAVPPSGAEGLGYVPCLDGLRGVAVLAVMLFHANLLPGGFLGVDVFFVLSGFLITTLLLAEFRKTGAISLKHFYLRRALRLLPALGGLLAACVVYVRAAWPQPLALRTAAELPFAVTYLSNWARGLYEVRGGLLAHAWSLSVEEQFYLLWAPVLGILLTLGLRGRRLFAFLSTLVMASAIERAVMLQGGATIVRLYGGSDTRADALLIGCAVAVVLSNWQVPSPFIRQALQWGSALVAAVFAVLAAFAQDDAPAFYLGGFTLVALGAAVLLLQLVVCPARWATTVLERPTLVGVGRISYGLYLWHFPVHQVLRSLLPDVPALALLPAYLAIAFTFALLSYRLLELPALRLKERMRPRPAVAVGSALRETSVAP